MRNGQSVYLIVAHCDLLIVSLSFLSRNGSYELVENRCKETLDFFRKQSFLMNKEKHNIDAMEILAMVYLCQSKKEGIELANKVLKYRNTLAENIKNPLFKQKWETSYNNFCEVNKTGIDIELQCIINQNKILKYFFVYFKILF